MRISSICIGDIKKISSLKKICCGQMQTIDGMANMVKYELETEDYKKNAVLIKIGENKYIDIDSIGNVWDFLLFFVNMIKSKDIVTETLLFHYASLGELFIDTEKVEFYDLYYELGLWQLKKIKQDNQLQKIIHKSIF